MPTTSCSSPPQRGYLMWVFRPVKGGIWAEYADDATLGPEGTRRGALPAPPDPADLRRQAPDGLSLWRAAVGRRSRLDS